jgi:hypothetical protein
VSNNEPVDAPSAYLLTDSPTGEADAVFEHICDLSPEQYERYKTTYKKLYDILFANTFAYFRGSAKAFASVWMSANKAFAEGEIRPTSDPDSVVIWGTQLRSVALTLCLSLCYHQEQTYREVSDEHGSDSDAFRAAKAIFGELHDNYPGYRYMYALRNAMIHEAMDAISLQATAALDENRKPFGVWDLQLDRNFLAQAKKLTAAKRAEFAALTENPSLPELFSQIAKPMMEANTKLLGLIHPDLTAVCSVAVEFDDLFGDREGTRMLSGTRSPELRPGMQIGFSSWPDGLLKFARQYEAGQEIWRHRD